MKFLLIAIPSQKHIGTFILNLENRTWCFRYSDDFIMNGEGVIKDFPEINKTYGHTACVGWLTSRMGSFLPDGKGIKLAEIINRYGNEGVQHLELHSVQ